jgi:predicted secreted protein
MAYQTTNTHVGRDVVVEFAIPAANDQNPPQETAYKRLGQMRAKTVATSWDTVDTTADMSPNFTRTSLVTFKSVEFSGDGVSYPEEMYNQRILEERVVTVPTGAAIGYQPSAWFRITYPDGRRYEGLFVVSEWSNESPYSDVSTWSITAASLGAVTFTPLVTTP